MVFYPKYPPEVYQFVKDNPNITGKALQKAISDKFGIDINRNTLHNLHNHHALGKPYKHGHCPLSWHLKPLGSERKDKDGYVRVLTPKGEKLKHHIVWEQYHEPIKSDECLMFLDGNRENCDISNLYLMKRKYMGAMNDYLKGIKDVELKKVSIVAAILKIEMRNKDIIANLNNPRRKPKTTKWREIIRLYLDGKTTSEIAELTGRNKAIIRWTVRRYNLGYYR